MKIIIGIMAMLLPVLSIGQDVKQLSLNDVVPDVSLSSVINHTKPVARLSHFKKDLVILDFWSSWCRSCIALFPHLDSLQHRFNNSIQIVLVNTKSQQYHDDANKIKRILARVKQYTGIAISLPVVYNCPKLDDYFPCITIPHEVWIYKGKVVGITYSGDLIPANIQGLLDGRSVHMRLKKDRFDVDIRKPLFIDDNGGSGKETIYRTLITGYIDGLAGGSGMRMKNGLATGLYSVNQSLYALIKTAWGNEISFDGNRVVFQALDKEKFGFNELDSGACHLMYSYDAILPPTNDSMVFIYMQQDLKRYFNISVKKEKMERKCLVLTDLLIRRTPLSLKEASADIESNSLKKYLYDYTPAAAIRLLNIYSNIPLINETKDTSQISIDLPFDINDTVKLRDAFTAAGLRLREEYRAVDVVVITDE